MDDMKSLSHSRWGCKYHIVFAPKYRRQAIYGDIRKNIGVILRKLCEMKGVETVEAELCKDSIHIFPARAEDCACQLEKIPQNADF